MMTSNVEIVRNSVHKDYLLQVKIKYRDKLL